MLRGDDCLGANSCSQAPSHSPWEYFRLPHMPCMQITPWDVTLPWVVSVPVAFQRWRVLSRPHTSCTDPSWVRSLPTGTGGVAWKPPFSSIITVWGAEARGLHAPTVPPPPRSFLPVGIGGWHHSGIGTFLVQNPVNIRGRSTSEAGQRPRPVNRPRSVNSLAHFMAPLMGLTMLTLVNARGWAGTISIMIWLINSSSR